MERRRAKRLALTAELIMNRLDTNEEESVKIEVLNISQTGIGFLCESGLEIGAKYDIKLKIWTGDVIHTIVDIVRVQDMEDIKKFYGGVFIGMSDSDRFRIQVYEAYQEYSQEEV
ncbi:PilZ domain-containing protein [bacterium C-53]|nr:PilZ domain-containing protein [Lachnospiraceae bacterium]NBI01815.1 PilZ domain-containing protein [Lachnospiraceae bacterium]RKJ12230.1 PilZ domain-containing protein [bacterium C-53]